VCPFRLFSLRFWPLGKKDGGAPFGTRLLLLRRSSILDDDDSLCSTQSSNSSTE
jgi:hypothetical protein